MSKKMKGISKTNADLLGALKRLQRENMAVSTQ
jgi:hypothetical protein